MSTIQPISVEQFSRFATYADADESGKIDTDDELRVVVRDFMALDTNGDQQIDGRDRFDAKNAAAVSRLRETGVAARHADPDYGLRSFDLVIVNSERADANQDLQADAYYGLGVMFVDSNKPAAASHCFLRAAKLLESIGATGTDYAITLAQHHKVASFAVTQQYAPLVKKLAVGLNVGEQRRLGALLLKSDNHLAQLEKLLAEPAVAEEVEMTVGKASAGRASIFATY